MFAAVVASLFGLILPWLLKRDWPWEPWVIAVAFFAWGLIAPSTVRPFYRLWMHFRFCHERHCDANYPWGGILCSYPSVWVSISSYVGRILCIESGIMSYSPTGSREVL